MRFLIVFGLACLCASAQDSAAQKIIDNEYQHHKLFWSSAAVFGAASAFDYATSIALNDSAKKGLVRERNDFLRNSYGGFDPLKGAAYKLGTRGAVVAAELWLRNRYSKSAETSRTLDRCFSAINFAVSGVFWKVGINNVRLGRPLGAF
ncbi:MAG: hypothetical protein ACR2NN_08790 [Bryobacteraceae bacterium]